ncbi:MAG: hypothetical protein DI586_03565 [Micavibrio aeruginosavorus]|uniref:Uncharacterized protein n=1 Tax=Micavibrio aeruginosavorus TaxID=349221 RepID=A0A2W5FKK2_9BACT|nr:MAG: hypothetical protein DI586_03565 [Micavibrio aeruginosavorus]
MFDTELQEIANSIKFNRSCLLSPNDVKSRQQSKKWMIGLLSALIILIYLFSAGSGTSPPRTQTIAEKNQADIDGIKRAFNAREKRCIEQTGLHCIYIK